MVFREAVVQDIPQLHTVRISVNENCLSNPDRITFVDYKEYLTERGRGWVCEIESEIVGFSIVDLREHNVWALFVLPQHIAKGIGKALLQLMIEWYFGQTSKTIWLSTGYNTRAAKFYQMQGWIEAGSTNDEQRFELSFENWNKRKGLRV